MSTHNMFGGEMKKISILFGWEKKKKASYLEL